MRDRLVERLEVRVAVIFLVLGAALVSGCPSPIPPRRDGGLTDSAVEEDTGVSPDAGDHCGNGTLDPGEECEGTDLGGETCASQGYPGGTLACGEGCRLDESGCDETPCGNGVVDAAEECDGADLDGASCATEGFLGGDIACAPDCTLDTTECDACGDGNLDEGELCDGTDLDGQTCASRGFTGGTLGCSAACTFDTGECVDTNCGNGAVDVGEDCDGTMFGSASCVSAGFTSGTLTCTPDCIADTSACTNCGNGIVDGVETCDGSAFAGRTCVTEGFTMGSLACTSGCAIDTSGCATAACGNGRVESGETCDDGNTIGSDGCTSCAVDAGYACTGTPSGCDPVCGDGMIIGGEACDGANLGGATCVSAGFPAGGTLTCTACERNTSGCLAGACGDGIVDVGEECDDGGRVRLDGCDEACRIEATFDLPVRLVGASGTFTGNRGRVEVHFDGAWRDVCDDAVPGEGSSTGTTSQLANVVCRQLGYTGTGHRTYTAGGGSASPVMDDVVCAGSEPNLSQCGFSGWNEENCLGGEALGIECMPGEGDVRLIGGTSSMEGRVQVFHAGAWGEVCDDYLEWTSYGVTTVCQQLGYRDGANSDLYSAPGDVFVLDNVNCAGTERRIDACPHNAYGSEDCSGFEAQGVVCTEYAEGDLRLVGGSGRNTGRVEVLHDGVWATVCNDGMEVTTTTVGVNFSAVTCGQLGFASGVTISATAVPDGVDPIGLDDLMCVGTETSLLMCPSRAYGTHNCGHHEDVGVTCTP